MVDPDVVLGPNARIFDRNLVNLFGCEIGEGSFVGPFVEITRGVVIGKQCVIESHSFICEAVSLEDHVFVGHGAMFTNDLYPRTDRHVVYRKTLVRRFASIGTNATVIGGVTIGEHAIVGAGAVVTKDVPDCSVVVGNPARVLRTFASGEELQSYIRERQPSKEP
jgi:acetyltransferase-like isoleucine patch superfamily enzyme